MQQLLGIAIVLGCIFGGYMLGGGALHAIWEPVELLIIAGAGFGALVLGNPYHVLHEMLVQLRRIVMMRKRDSEFQRQLLLLMYELLQTDAKKVTLPTIPQSLHPNIAGAQTGPSQLHPGEDF